MKLIVVAISIIFAQLMLPSSDAKGIDGKVKLRLYRKSSKVYHATDIDQALDLFNETKGFDKNNPIILIIHGMATGADSHFVNGLVNAYFKRGLNRYYNIFALDMPKLFENNIFHNFYFGVLSNVKPAGEKIGNFLNQVINKGLASPDRINLVGYSIGAQVAGYAARVVLGTFGPVSYIAGLDPAGPGFHTVFRGMQRLIHVSQEDANITHFFHTNSVMCGTMDRVGTADFVFNDGGTQPGCTRESSLDCSHSRIPFLYIEAITHPRRFIGRHCNSWEQFTKCQCDQHSKVQITFPPDTRAHGIYYLQTNARSPFGMGKVGAQCQKAVYSNTTSKDLVGNFNQKFKMVPSLLDLNLFENHKINQLSQSGNQKGLKNNFNVHIMNGIKKMEDFQQGGKLKFEKNHGPQVTK